MNKEEVVVELLASLEGKKEAMHIRNLVFVQEQNVSAEEEYDEFDAIAVHYLARLGSEYVGTARWRLVEDKIKFERFAVLKEHRGKGVGDKLLEACFARCSLLLSSSCYLPPCTNSGGWLLQPIWLYQSG